MIERLLAMALGLTAGGALAAFAALCITEPDRIAGYFRQRYLKRGKFVRMWPFSNVVMRAWYPTYLRIWGLFGLVLGLGMIVVSIFIGFMGVFPNSR